MNGTQANSTPANGTPAHPPPAGPGVETRPARLAVGVIGAGRAGCALGAALANAGHRLVAASAISEASRRRVAELLPGVAVRAVDEVPAGTDLVLLTVPDDALPGLVRGLAAADAVRPGQLVAHASGAHGLAVLEPLTLNGALPLALHPVMTFTGTAVDVARLDGVSFGVTAPEALRPVAEALVVEMGGEPVWIAEQARPLYHAALAGGANHLITLVATTMDLLARAGVENPPRILGPLLGAALDNALRFGDAALTGPVARADTDTVRAHVAALRETDPRAAAAYVALARLTADRALASGGLDATAAVELLDVLAGRVDGARP